MTNIMFDIPSREDIVKCVITADTVANETEPKLVIDEKKNRLKDAVEEDSNSEADAS